MSGLVGALGCTSGSLANGSVAQEAGSSVAVSRGFVGEASAFGGGGVHSGFSIGGSRFHE
jgi:hypothetical protein